MKQKKTERLATLNNLKNKKQNSRQRIAQWTEAYL